MSKLTIITSNIETIESIKLNTDVDIKIVNSVDEVDTEYYTSIPYGICNTVELLDIDLFLNNNDYDIVFVPFLKASEDRMLDKLYTKIYKKNSTGNKTYKLEIDYFYLEKHI